jgi:hypothetical protein
LNILSSGPIFCHHNTMSNLSLWSLADRSTCPCSSGDGQPSSG